MYRRMNPAPCCDNVQMKKDADECAAVIFADLGIKPGNRTARPIRYICWKYSPHLLFLEPDDRQLWGSDSLPDDFPNMSRRFPGVYIWRGEGERSYILISQELSDKEQCAVMVHELTHHLIFQQIYEPLNDARFSKYPVEHFQELVARAVERRFLLAGGTGVCTAKDLE